MAVDEVVANWLANHLVADYTADQVAHDFVANSIADWISHNLVANHVADWLANHLVAHDDAMDDGEPQADNAVKAKGGEAPVDVAELFGRLLDRIADPAKSQDMTRSGP
jgi:hypothetical protein